MRAPLPVGRVLHVSSIVAVGPALGTATLDERSEYHGDRFRCDYMTTKRRAEELALEAAARTRPGGGQSWRDLRRQRATSNTQRVIHMIASGRTGPLPALFAPPGEQSVVGLDDCAEGCALALEAGLAGASAICWSNPPGVTAN